MYGVACSQGHKTDLRATFVESARKSLFASSVNARDLSSKLQAASIKLGDMLTQVLIV